MNRLRILLLLVAPALVVTGNVLATPPTPGGLSALPLARSLFGEIDLQAHDIRWHVKMKTKGDSDVHVTQNTFQPGAHSGWHTHPGPSLITVTSGQITAYDGDDPTCTPMIYNAGDGFTDPGSGHVHLLRNETGAPAVTIAVQILPKDAQRRIDAPSPGNCPF
jgi:quercetin dioxygenase-like cupin family protein